jgi:hypothetical protein
MRRILMSYNNNKGGNGFDLNKYENVKSRKVRLRNDFPDSLIMPLPVSDLTFAGNYIVMGALIWKDKKVFENLSFEILEKIGESASKATPQNIGMIMTAIAIATRADGAGFSLSIAGGKGADKSAWVENAEESAVGRALDNMGYHSGSASQEEMAKVQHIINATQERVQLENQINSQYSALMQQGHHTDYISQVISQTVRPFNQLSELSPEEMTKMLNALINIGSGQGAYQQQQQNQSPAPQAPPVPGAPAPAYQR